jgi:hypothetical protein
MKKINLLIILTCCLSFLTKTYAEDCCPIKIRCENAYTVIDGLPYPPDSYDCLIILEFMQNIGMIQNSYDVFFDENDSCYLKIKEDFISKISCKKTEEEE